MVYEPVTDDVTWKTIVQVALAAMVPSVSVMLVLVLVIVPPHWGVVGVPMMVILAGKTSVKFTPVKGIFRQFLSVMVTVAGLPAMSVVGENALVPVNAVRTAKLADTSAGLEPPLSEVRSPALMVFV